MRWWLGLGMAAAVSGSAHAAQFDLNATIVSDARFRGESVSNRQPAFEAAGQVVQGDWFAGIDATSNAYSRAPLAASGHHAEFDVSGGWSHSFGILTPSAGVIGYVYPGARRADYVEVFGALTGSLGPFGLTGGVNFAPGQGNLPRDSLYLYLTPSVAIPATPITLKASFGREAGALQGGPRAKFDYGVAVEAKVARRITLSARWTANSLGAAAYDRRMARGGVAVGVGAGF